MPAKKIVKRRVVKKAAKKAEEPAPAPVPVESDAPAAPAAAAPASWLAGLLDNEVNVQGLRAANAQDAEEAEAAAEAEESASEGAEGENENGETLMINGLEDEEEAGGQKRLWQDDDDDAAAEQPARKMAKVRTQAAPGWAAVEPDADDEDAQSDISEEEAYTTGGAAGDLFKSTAALVDRSRGLPAGTLDHQKLKDGNAAEYSEARLGAVHFHPNGSLLLTAAPDFRLRLFQVDGATSTKIQTVKFRDLPLQNAQFTPSGTKIVCTGKRDTYGVVDVETSTVDLVTARMQAERNLQNFSCSPHADQTAFSTPTGSVYVVSMASHAPVFSVKGEGPSNAVAYHPTREHELWTLGGSKVYVWDVRTRRPLRIHEDEGAMTATALAVSETRYAVGSTNGIVNMYDIPAAFPANPIAAAPAPVKALTSLTTEVEFAKFNPTGEVLCYGSAKKKNALRMIHTATLTTFANFPREGHYYRKPSCCDFSPASGLLCVGNDRGRALLFRMNYYGTA